MAHNLKIGDKVTGAAQLEEGDVVRSGSSRSTKKLVSETIPAEDGLFEPNARVVLKSFETGEEKEVEGQGVAGMVLTEADE